MPFSRPLRLSALDVLLLTFVLLATIYSLIIPLFEGPDEDDHFRYARFIAETRALPVQVFEPGGGAAGHQGWQPPLYYSLASLLIAPIDTSDLEQHLWRNEAATFVGDPTCCGRNIYYHNSSENWPFSQTTLAVHLARLLTIAFGVATLWSIYTIVRTIFPQRPVLALAATAVAGFNPSFLFSSALVSNDIPLAAFCSLTLLATVKLLKGEWDLGWKQGALVGLLLGLAVLTKTTALGLVPFAVFSLLIVGWRANKGRLVVAPCLSLLVVFAAAAGWWFWRNQWLYGDPLAYRLMTTSALFPRSGPLTFAELAQISFPWLWQTFWGGPTPGDFAPALLWLLGVLAAVGILGSAVWLVRQARSVERVIFLVLGGWLAFILVAQMQFIRTTVGADQGRYLFPALAVIALLLVTGWDTLVGLVGTRAQTVANSLVVVAAIALAMYVPLAYTLPAYARPAPISSEQVGRIENRLDADFSDRVQLLGYDLGAASVRQGDVLPVTLYWRALGPIDKSYRVFVHLVGMDGRTGGGADVIPGRGSNPTVYWQPGEVLKDTVQVRADETAVPGKYSIEVGLYPVGHPNDRMGIVGQEDDRVLVGAAKIAPLHPITVNPPLRTDADFGVVKLVGYDAKVISDSLLLSLYWVSHTPVSRDYTVFVHMLDSEGRIVKQIDRYPQEGNYPTSIWSAGEQIRDDYTLDLGSTDLSNSRLEIGMYLAETGERLLRVDAHGTAVGDSLVVPLSLTGQVPR